MVSTALGLSVAGIVTGVRKEISLVDALIIIDGESSASLSPPLADRISSRSPGLLRMRLHELGIRLSNEGRGAFTSPAFGSLGPLQHPLQPAELHVRTLRLGDRTHLWRCLV